MKKQCVLCRKVFTVDLIRRRRYMQGICPLPRLCPGCRGKLMAFGEEGKAKLTVGDLPILPEYISIFSFKIRLQRIKDFFVIILIILGLLTTIYFRDLFAIVSLYHQNQENNISTQEPIR